jgi:carbon monoxide dehydrogenase subunit G
MPGCESLAAKGENCYEFVMNAAIGAAKSRFNGSAELGDLIAPDRYTMKFDSSDGEAGSARGVVRVALADAGAGTRLSYKANVQIDGTLAKVEAKLIDAAASAMADRFFEAFDARLRARARAELEATRLHFDADLLKSLRAPATSGVWSRLKMFLTRLFRRH